MYISEFSHPRGQFQQERFISTVANQLRLQGYCVVPKGLPELLAEPLYAQLQKENAENFKPAGIGRKSDKVLNEAVRGDSIQWIDNVTSAGAEWLRWMEELKIALNRELLLGLFSFESHFACYAPGAFYKKHLDAFPGDANRVLSVVVYLNADWQQEDGGELLLYDPQSDHAIETVSPDFGTMVFFLSEEFPHEVCVAQKKRYSIAGWYRLNSSMNGLIDPPR
ncbi:hypothetical protein TDB9533_00279 [Thalassocella blandensis]|nr:hypothetical protein TDB9533_00279 [Thalassocella blandensis]